MKELFQYGFGIHHAGMLRSDRSLTERMFADGSLKVLCCTATLAWGVNLPAYAVVIKGTQVYDSTKGSFVDLSILDVLQIFGRAGRPQYETHGVGYILTTHDRLSHYISAITQQHPIESKFIENIVDNLNAEISLGTVTNIDEAVTWLSYTYLYVRMRKNPMVYGMSHSEPVEDPLLGRKRHEIITMAARKLAECQMILFDGSTGYLVPKDLGRIASNFYIKHKSIEIFNSMMKPRMTEADVLAMISLSSEFDQIKSRETEHQELKKLLENACACDIKVIYNHIHTYIYINSFPIREVLKIHQARSTFYSKRIFQTRISMILHLFLTVPTLLRTQAVLPVPCSKLRSTVTGASLPLFSLKSTRLLKNACGLSSTLYDRWDYR